MQSFKITHSHKFIKTLDEDFYYPIFFIRNPFIYTSTYFLSTVQCYSWPSPFQKGFQKPASPVMEGIIDFHHDLMFFLLIILGFVIFFLSGIASSFINVKPKKKNSNVSVSLNSHQTILEIIWTLLPAIILLSIVLPSFALIYSMDEFFLHPRLTIKAIGNQWYWTYNYGCSLVGRPGNKDNAISGERFFELLDSKLTDLKKNDFYVYDSLIGSMKISKFISFFNLSVFVNDLLKTLVENANIDLLLSSEECLSILEDTVIDSIVYRITNPSIAWSQKLAFISETSIKLHFLDGVLKPALKNAYNRIPSDLTNKSLEDIFNEALGNTDSDVVLSLLNQGLIDKPMANLLNEALGNTDSALKFTDTSDLAAKLLESKFYNSSDYAIIAEYDLFSEDPEEFDNLYLDVVNPKNILPLFQFIVAPFRNIAYNTITELSYFVSAFLENLASTLVKHNALPEFVRSINNAKNFYNHEVNLILRSSQSLHDKELAFRQLNYKTMAFTRVVLTQLLEFTVSSEKHLWNDLYDFITNTTFSHVPSSTSVLSHVKLKFDSYMLPDDLLPEGGLRLLEVDKRLLLPSKTGIRLLVSSYDVLHSWAVPALGLKLDGCPGRLNQTFLFIKHEGLYYGQCSEICGVNHGFMPIVIRVISLKDFNFWINRQVESHQLLTDISTSNRLD